MSLKTSSYNKKGSVKTPFYFLRFCGTLKYIEFKGDFVDSVFDRIYDVVSMIPKGKVATYGLVAQLAGNKRWARVVGYALHKNPDRSKIPCHRVVNREGRVAKAFVFGGENEQVRLLEEEGVQVTDSKVDLEKYLWDVGVIL